MIELAALPIKIVKGEPTGAGIFWFTTQESITLEDPAQILAPIWTVGHVKHRQEKHSLIDYTPVRSPVGP